MKQILVLATAFFYIQSAFSQSYGDYAVKIDVAGNGFGHQSIVYFDDESWDPQQAPTYGWDPCCDALLVLGNPNQPQIFTEVVAPPASPNNHRLSINGLPHLFEPTDVPLGFMPGTLAQYTFSFTELYTLPLGVTLELEDLAQNVTQDLLLDSSYQTWGAVSDNEARFILHFYPANVTGLNSSQAFGSALRIASHEDRVLISGMDSDEETQVRLFNVLGNLCWQNRVKQGQNDFSIQRSSVETGIYFLELTTKSGNRKAVKIVL